MYRKLDIETPLDLFIRCGPEHFSLSVFAHKGGRGGGGPRSNFFFLYLQPNKTYM